MHVYHFRIHISAVFRLFAMNFTPYSPTVTWYMCAKFAAFTIFGTQGVNVGVWSSCGHCTISKWSDCMGCGVKVVHHEDGAYITSFINIALP